MMNKEEYDINLDHYIEITQREYNNLKQENKALKETLKQLYRIHSTSNMSEEEWLDYAIKYNSGQLGGKE